MARTTAELQKVLQQYRAAKSGTKPPGNSTIKTGFISGKDASPKDFSSKELHNRQSMKARIQKIKSSFSPDNKPMTDRQVERQTGPRINQGNPQNKPPRFPAPRPTPPTKPTTPAKMGPSIKPTGVDPVRENAMRKRMVG